MSDTPRTDAETWRDEMDHVDTDYTFAQSITVSADFARQLERELAKARELLIKCLSVMPVGYIPTHTVVNLPERIGDLAKALAKETTEREQLERELAEARKQRDTLAEALNHLIRGASDLANVLDCCEDGPTASDLLRWDVIGAAREALASLKGGSP